MKKLLTLIVLVLALALTLAACGQADQGANENPDDGNIDAGNNGNENVVDPCDHEWGEEELVVPEGKNICENGGTYQKSCAKCGEIYSRAVEPKDHDFTEYVPKDESADNKFICVDGGTLIRTCKVCSKNDEFPVAPGEYPHTVENWMVTTVPTDANNGLISGTCIVCKSTENVTFELPAFDTGAYEIEPIKEVSCAEDGNYKYIYVNEELNINVGFEVAVAATGHKLHGQNYVHYNINDGSYGLGVDEIIIPYWYGAANASGRLSAIGNIKSFNGAKFVCETVQNGYFNCEDCNAVINVNVYYAHNGASEIALEPTCQATGLLELDCDSCDYDSLSEDSSDAPIVIETISHSYIYELVDLGSKYTDSEGKEWDLYNLAGTCIGNNCDSCGNKNVLYGNIYNVEKVELVAPTCIAYGSVVYTFNMVDYDISYSTTVNVPKINHVLGGEPVKSYNDMTTDTDGITEFANAAFKTAQCESMVDAYFVCEYCEGIISIQVKKVHSIIDIRVDLEPTCDKDGSKSYMCANENCNKPAGTRFSEAIDPIGHSYEYKIVDHCLGMNDEQIKAFVDLYGYRYVISKVCTRNTNDTICGSIDSQFGTDGSLNAKELNKIDEKKPTCYAEGYVIYSLQIDDKIVELKVVYAKINHTLAGLIVGSKEFNEKHVNPDNGAIYSTTPGIKLFANSNLACDTVAEGYYECAACKAAGVKDYLITVNVYKNHVIGEIITPSTCTVKGAAKCADCDIASLPLDELGHNFDYSIVDLCMGMTATEIEEYVKLNGYRFIISMCCVREENDKACGAINPDFGIDGCLYEKELTVVNEKKPTCYSDGYVIYSLKIDDKLVDLKVVYAKINHTLAGLIVGSKEFNEKYVNPDNGAIYSTTSGVKLFANSKPACGTVVDGYYECEVCKAKGVNTDLNTIKVYKSHFVGEIITHSTCTEEGTANCADCDTVLTLPALGHYYDYHIEDDCKNMTEEEIANFIATYGYRYKISRVCIREVDGIKCGDIDLTFGQKGYLYTKEPNVAW